MTPEASTRVEALRTRARELRSLTHDTELRWELAHAEALIEVLANPAIDPQTLQANMDYVSNLLSAISDRIIH